MFRGLLTVLNGAGVYFHHFVNAVRSSPYFSQKGNPLAIPIKAITL